MARPVLRRITAHTVLNVGYVGTGRVEAFTDGVMAVAITLLVLEIKVPETSSPISFGLRPLTAGHLTW